MAVRPLTVGNNNEHAWNDVSIPEKTILGPGGRGLPDERDLFGNGRYVIVQEYDQTCG
jgi:hypothetical protein